MSLIIKLLKFLSGFIGGMFIFLAVTGLVLSMFGDNLLKNTDNLSVNIKSSATKFIAENKPELRQFILSQFTEFGQAKIDKQTAIQACQQKELIKSQSSKIYNNPTPKYNTPTPRFKNSELSNSQVSNTQALNFQGNEISSILTDDFCKDVGSLTEEQLKNKLADTFIDAYTDQFINQSIDTKAIDESTSQVKSMARQYLGKIQAFIIIFFLLGIFFTFGAAGFNFRRGLYKNLLKIGIFFGIAIIPFLFIYILTPSSLLALIKGFMPSQFATIPMEIQGILYKFVASIALDWIKLSVKPVLIFSIVMAIVLILLAILVKIKLIKK